MKHIRTDGNRWIDAAQLNRSIVTGANASKMNVKPGQSCGHPGCLSHISHPCEGCGRIGGDGYYFGNEKHLNLQ